MKKIKHHPFFIRLFHWEYWPFHVVYALLYPYWLWLCVKARSLFFFNLSNPGIKNGGFLMDSKKEIYDLIPKQYYPRTLFFEKETPFIYIKERLELDDYIFPLVGKPDIGMRGIGVQKLNTWDEAEQYAANSKVNFLIQEFVSFEKEAGIFYYRIPGIRRGIISGIVQKEFLTVTGDGISTIEELLQKDTRYILQLTELKKIHGQELNKILCEGEALVLVPYGNHARGAKFIDVSDQIDEQLTNMIDKLCRKVRGFYYGRLDIRFKSWDDLRQGKNFCIIELNGAGSEPTHIYDPAHSVFFAWKEIIRHWRILYKISKINRRRTQKGYMSFSLGVKMFRENFEYLKLLREGERA
jgi:hypothetical protein